MLRQYALQQLRGLARAVCAHQEAGVDPASFRVRPGAARGRPRTRARLPAQGPQPPAGARAGAWPRCRAGRCARRSMVASARSRAPIRSYCSASAVASAGSALRARACGQALSHPLTRAGFEVDLVERLVRAEVRGVLRRRCARAARARPRCGRSRAGSMPARTAAPRGPHRLPRPACAARRSGSPRMRCATARFRRVRASAGSCASCASRCGAAAFHSCRRRCSEAASACSRGVQGACAPGASAVSAARCARRSLCSSARLKRASAKSGFSAIALP
jgi:hypothetical protein